MRRSAGRQAALALPLPHPTRTRAPLLINPPDAAVIDRLLRPAAWGARVLLLVGAEGAGKSRLVAHFAERHLGRAIDDADRAEEAELFAAWNEAQSAAPLLLTARRAPSAWGTVLPDLASRLAAVPVLTLAAPEPGFIAERIDAELAARRLGAPPGVGAAVATRLAREHAAISRAVDAILAAAHATGRAPGPVSAVRALVAAGVVAPDLADLSDAAA